jgi:hypothetical protein
MQAVNEPNVKHFDIAVVIHPTDTLLECSFSSCVALDAIVLAHKDCRCHYYLLSPFFFSFIDTDP